MRAKKQYVTFKKWKCVLERPTYQNGRPALVLIDAKDGEPVATATVNLPEVALAEGHVFVKDYSENEGMLAALVAAGIVADTGSRVQTGYVSVPVARLL